MSWTKEDLNFTCIKITSYKQMKKVVDFYKSFGIDGDIKDYHGKNKGMVIYIRNNHMWADFGLFPTTSFNRNNIIKLPSKPRRTFPREMMVSDDGIYWHTRTVLAKCTKLHYPFITASPPYKPKNEFQIRMRNWRYAKEID